jgi:hypothetical protein
MRITEKLFCIALTGIAMANNVCAEDKAKPTPKVPKAEVKKAEVVKKAEELPENIKLIIGQGKTKNYYFRVRAIHRLANNLPQSQVEALYKFLYTRLEKQKLKNLEFNALKNEIVLELMKQKIKPGDLAGHLVKMYQDKTFDPTWRDYCVQFFGKWYAAAPRNEARDEMLKNLWDATTETSNSNAGTAVTMLIRMLDTGDIDKKKLSKAAYKVLTAKGSILPNKISSLQVCAELNNADALPIARQIVNSRQNKILQMSAIAAIGMLGDRSDLPLLYKLQKSTDIRKRSPAKAAIKKINKRF